MMLPSDDPDWGAAADFVGRRRKPHDAVLAPDAFVWCFDRIYRYANSHLDPDCAYDWAIVHRAMLDEIAVPVLAALPRAMRPVFVNRTFVVWSRDTALPRIGRFNRALRDHARAVAARMRQRGPASPAGTMNRVPPSPEDGVLQRFAALSLPDLKRTMDRVFAGGRAPPSRRELARRAALDRHLRDIIGDTASLRVLDLCCGEARLGEALGPCATLAQVDLSETALANTRRAGHRDDAVGAVMDAQNLAFASGSFDVVFCVDALEYVHDAERMLSEAVRVLAPRGRFVIVAENSDSLHRVTARKLGQAGRLSNPQHMRLFAYRELCELLEAKGLAVDDARGLGLEPYTADDRPERRLAEDDAETADLLTHLGEKAGPEYTRWVLVTASKPRPKPKVAHQIRFGIAFVGRQGSSYLEGLLNSHPDAVCLGELLSPAGPYAASGGGDIRAYLDTTLHALPARAVGFKTPYQTFLERPALWEIVSDLSYRFVWLTRENLVDQYISFKLAMINNAWRSDLAPTTIQSFTADFTEAEVFFVDIRGKDELLRRALSAFDCLHVTYEEITGGEGVAKVLQFLDLGPAPLTSAYTRQRRTASQSEAITNFEAMKSHFAGSPWERYFVG